MAWGAAAWGPTAYGADGDDPPIPCSVLENNMAKTQFVSSEPLRLVFFPFFDKDNAEYVVGGTDVATLVVKKPDGNLLLPAPTLVFDSDTNFWVVEVDVSDYMEGDWLVRATSDAFNTLPQFRIFTWGDYVDDLPILKAIGTGRWKVDTGTNTMKLYAADDVTVLYEFDLKDAAGNPTTDLIYERAPVP